LSRISQFQGSIKRTGSPAGNLTGGSVTCSNNLEKIETIRDDSLIEGADPTIAALSGRIDVRFPERRRSTWPPTACSLEGIGSSSGSVAPISHAAPSGAGGVIGI
jgi:hypothetical protein